MLNNFSKHPLWECNKTLIRVAQGFEPASLVVKHANLISTTTAEILHDVDIAVAAGRVAYLGIGKNSAKHCIGQNTKVVDASGFFVAPGFIDSHIHIESAMVSPAEYARMVVPNGTCAIYADPHECANVCGIAGVKEMLKNAKGSPLKTMLTTPSCAPAAPGFDDAASSINASCVAGTMKWNECVGLGEVMNYPQVLGCEENIMEEINETLKAGKCVCGHYTNMDKGLAGYVSAGVSCCHESVCADEAIAKLRCGMYVQARYGSAWLSLPNYLPQVVESGVDTRLICLCTDDNHPNTLIGEGGMNRAIKKCVELGINPVLAIQLATINAAEMLEISSDMGSITPGKCADMVFLPDLENFKPASVYIDGELVAEAGKPTFECKKYTWPGFMTSTMNLGRTLNEADFAIPAKTPGKTCKVRAIASEAGSTITKNVVIKVPVENGFVCAVPEKDILKVAVFDRHHGASGTHALGFCTGFGIVGALAQTVAHDSHNLLVVGSNDVDMALAANKLIECKGGVVAVVGGEVKAMVELPICGLMSMKPAQVVAREVEAIEKAWRQMGCSMPSPFMTMALLSLPCLPSLRITNRAYVNCDTYEFESLFVH